MNRFVTAIAVTAILLLAQGFSRSPKAEEKPVAATKQQESHSMSLIAQVEQSTTIQHGGEHPDSTEDEEPSPNNDGGQSTIEMS